MILAAIVQDGEEEKASQSATAFHIRIYAHGGGSCHQFAMTLSSFADSH
jgi:hypothetical protein